MAEPYSWHKIPNIGEANKEGLDEACPKTSSLPRKQTIWTRKDRVQIVMSTTHSPESKLLPPISSDLSKIGFAAIVFCTEWFGPYLIK